MNRLIYFADPMCSWCYGFGPALKTMLTVYPDLPVLPIMGGLRAGNTAVMDAAQKAMIRGHWKNVAQASGQPFDYQFFERDGFVYDTEPACRAVVTLRETDAKLAIPMFHAIQHAFYACNRDVTRPEVLADVAASIGADRVAFLAAFDAEVMRAMTREDFVTSKKSGVSGYPTLALDLDDEAWLVTSGFVTVEELSRRMEALLSREPSPA